MIEIEINNLTEPHREYISRENLLRDSNKSASEIAREWANLGHPIFTACYLSIVDDLNKEGKSRILADAYENKSRDLASRARFLLEKTGNDNWYYKQARANFEKSVNLRLQLSQK